MDKYYFKDGVWETPTTYITQKVIKYRCLICGYTHEYDDTWTDEKKLEVKAVVDKHHTDHII